jgi:hypothetical protein
MKNKSQNNIKSNISLRSTPPADTNKNKTSFMSYTKFEGNKQYETNRHEKSSLIFSNDGIS